MPDHPTALVSEAFISVQGEGKLTGVPSWFLRLSGCNLRCTWCDTPYASWNAEGEKRSIESLLTEAEATAVRHAVLTGGEPMIFSRLPSICDGLRARGMHITIETAGTVFPEGWSGLACDLMSISPKLSNSTPVDDDRDPLRVWADRHEQRRLDPDVINRLLRAFPDHQLKFVVASPADLQEIDDLLARLSDFVAGDVMLMPEGVTTPDPESVRWVIETCLERGWRYCNRLHIELFGDTRGT